MNDLAKFSLNNEFNNVRICYLEDGIKRVSVPDVISAVLGKGSNSRMAFLRLKQEEPELFDKLKTYKFSGRGQTETYVADIEVAVEIISLLPSKRAKQCRAAAMKALVAILQPTQEVVDMLQDRLDASRSKEEGNSILVSTDQKVTTLASRAYEGTYVYVRVRYPDEYIRETNNHKALTLDILKFGIAYSLNDRNHTYLRSDNTDNGYMLFSYLFYSRAEAQAIENILKIDFGHITVNGSKEYVDTTELANILRYSEYDKTSYASYISLAEKLFQYIIRLARMLWPERYDGNGYIHHMTETTSKYVQSHLTNSLELTKGPVETIMSFSDAPYKVDSDGLFGAKEARFENLFLAEKREHAATKRRLAEMQQKYEPPVRINTKPTPAEKAKVRKLAAAEEAKGKSRASAHETTGGSETIITKSASAAKGKKSDTGDADVFDGEDSHAENSDELSDAEGLDGEDADDEGSEEQSNAEQVDGENPEKSDRRSHGRVIGRDIITGEEVTYESCEKAANACDRTPKSLRDNFLDKPRQLKGRHWRREGQPFWIPPRGLRFDPEHVGNTDRYVKMVNVDDENDVAVYESMAVVADVLKLDRTTMRECMNRNRPYKGYLLSDLPGTERDNWTTDESATRTPNMEAIKRMDTGRNGRCNGKIIATDLETGEEVEHPSATRAGARLNMSPAAFRNNFVDKPRQSEGKIFRSFDAEQRWNVPAYFKYDKKVTEKKTNGHIVSVDKDGNMVLYESVQAASKLENINKSAIQQFLDSEKWSQGRQWRRATTEEIGKFVPI